MHTSPSFHWDEGGSNPPTGIFFGRGGKQIFRKSRGGPPWPDFFCPKGGTQKKFRAKKQKVFSLQTNKNCRICPKKCFQITFFVKRKEKSFAREARGNFFSDIKILRGGVLSWRPFSGGGDGPPYRPNFRGGVRPNFWFPRGGTPPRPPSLGDIWPGGEGPGGKFSYLVIYSVILFLENTLLLFVIFLKRPTG